MKRILLALLLAFVLEHAPLRLIALVAQTFVVSPGAVQLTDSNEGYWKAVGLEARLAPLGWDVEFRSKLESNGSTLYGATIPSEHEILIDADLHWSARFAVLAHEAGHTMQPWWLRKEQGECFAEAVATLMSGDGIREHARYLAPLKWTCAEIVISEWRAIYHAAAVLEDR